MARAGLALAHFLLVFSFRRMRVSADRVLSIDVRHGVASCFLFIIAAPNIFEAQSLSVANNNIASNVSHLFVCYSVFALFFSSCLSSFPLVPIMALVDNAVTNAVLDSRAFAHEMKQLQMLLEDARAAEQDRFATVQLLQAKVTELVVRIDGWEVARAAADDRLLAGSGADVPAASSPPRSAPRFRPPSADSAPEALAELAQLLGLYETEYAAAEAAWKEAALLTAEFRAEISDLIRTRNGDNDDGGGSDGASAVRYCGPHSLDASKPVPRRSAEICAQPRALVTTAYPPLDPQLDTFERLPLGDARLQRAFAALAAAEGAAAPTENGTPDADGTSALSTASVGVDVVRAYFEAQACGLPLSGPAGGDFVLGTLAAVRPSPRRGGGRSAVDAGVGAKPKVRVSFEEFALLAARFASM